jgi:predicted CopG family antitoxin
MSKNIAVSDDVYESLNRLKLENESFSEVIRRLLEKKALLSDIAGTKTFSFNEWAEIKIAFSNQDDFDTKRKKALLEKLG